MGTYGSVGALGGQHPGPPGPEQIGIVKLHPRYLATHALNGLAASVWDRASKARIGITLASQKAAGVVVLSHEWFWRVTTRRAPDMMHLGTE